MPIVNPHAGGIDIGATSNYVAIGSPNNEDVRQFGVYTEDLISLAVYLVSSGITSVAMEATGSYWQQLYKILIEYDLEVILVSGRFTKNVKGKKTDVSDAIWIQKLHSMGLLPNSFLPDALTSRLRDYVRHRKNLLQDNIPYKQRMQKSLRLMNIRLDNVLNDCTGVSGKKIISAIIAGERDGNRLASLADYRVKKSKEEIAKALTGNWRDEMIFELRQSYEIYCYLESKIAEVDTKIEELLQQATSLNPASSPEPTQKSAKKKESIKTVLNSVSKHTPKN